jgi:kanamycin kinase/aminoglycoside 3'-phosphotransferase-3
MDTIGKSDSSVVIFDDMVLKIQKQSQESDNEHGIMMWLDGKLPVPRVLGFEKQEGYSFLLMSKIDGVMSCHNFYLERPDELTMLLAEGLKMLWDVDVACCPFLSHLHVKLTQAQYNVQMGLVDVDDAQPETFGERGFKNPERLLQWLMDNKPEEELVLSHGDFCLPNIFLKEHKVSGFIDLGKMGIADKYQDIALCYRSLKKNLAGAYGGSVREEIDDKLLFDNLGIAPDYEKIRYYILLDELF